MLISPSGISRCHQTVLIDFEHRGREVNKTVMDSVWVVFVFMQLAVSFGGGAHSGERERERER